MPVIVPLILAFTLILALSLSNAVLGQAARPDPNYVCFLGVQSLNDLIPIIYYAMIAMLGVGSIGTAVMSVRSGHGSPRLVMWGGAVVLALSALLMGGIDSNRAYAQAAGSCLLRDGSLAMTGNLDMGTNNITSTGSINASGGGSLTGTWSDLGTVSTVDIDGGTVDGATLGAATPAAGTLTTLEVDNTTLNANTLSTSAGDLTLNPADEVIISQALELNQGSTDFVAWTGSSSARNVSGEPAGTVTEFIFGPVNVTPGATQAIVTWETSNGWAYMSFAQAELRMTTTSPNITSYVEIDASKRYSGAADKFVHLTKCQTYTSLSCFVAASDFTLVDTSSSNVITLRYTNNEANNVDVFGVVKVWQR